MLFGEVSSPRSALSSAPRWGTSIEGSKSYRRIAVDEQAEVLSFLGDIAHAAGEPVVHVHVVLGLADGSTRGGHLLDASVWPTLELVLTEWPKYLCKRSDPEVGLALLPGSAGADPHGA